MFWSLAFPYIYRPYGLLPIHFLYATTRIIPPLARFQGITATARHHEILQPLCWPSGASCACHRGLGAMLASFEVLVDVDRPVGAARKWLGLPQGLHRGALQRSAARVRHYQQQLRLGLHEL